MDEQDPRLRNIWKQREIPVVFRQARPKPLLVRLPFLNDNYAWLRGENKRKPKWNSQHIAWEVPIAWFDELIHRLLKRHGRVYVIQLHNEMQKCAPACWNAEGFHCECSCLGANHGTGHPGATWHEIAETFAFSWGPRQYACRLIVASNSSLPA